MRTWDKEKSYCDQYLVDVTGGDESLICELLTIFFEDTAPRIEEIQRVCAEKKYGLLHRQLHTLKGASSQVGAPQLEAIAKVLEMHCFQENYEQVDSHLEDLATIFGRFQETIKERYPNAAILP